MPLDKQSEAVRVKAEAMGLPSIHSISPLEARSRESQQIRTSGPTVHRVQDYLIRGSAGMLTGRVYFPTERGPFPVLVWFHGGGWVQGGLEETDSIVREIAVRSECVVVSVGYRLAPETKFPYPVEDCYAATQWVVENAEKINAGKERVAVGGYSAGGNLAAAVSLMARDRGEFDLSAQLLLCPVLDRDFTRRSYIKYGEGYGLTMESMKWYWNHYLNDVNQSANPYAAPLKSENLAGVSECLIVTADHDPLSDEGEAYAMLLSESGVSVKLSAYTGVMHGFISMSDVVDTGMKAIQEAAEFLNGRLSN